jgi:hypothetical protein
MRVIVRRPGHSDQALIRLRKSWKDGRRKRSAKFQSSSSQAIAGGLSRQDRGGA